MKYLVANLKNYWKLIVIIFFLLVLQAYCDLSLPNYTSDIIDIGITNSGLEHATPEYVGPESYQSIAMFMTEEEASLWSTSYTYNEEKGRNELTEEAKANIEALDSTFTTPIAIVYMMKQMSASAENKENAPAMPTDITLLEMRQGLEDKLSILGDSMLVSYAKAFTKSEYEALGINLSKMQSDYMWRIGSIMLTMSFLMAILAILVSYFASRTGASVGRDLREKVFNKVVRFSDAEINKFSTASLITRSTNDVQQVQMVTIMMLRMILYAPIMAIGGIINVANNEAGMGWIIVLAVAAVLCVIGSLVIVAMPKFKLMQILIDRVNLVSREILTGLPVIRAFSREKKEEERFDAANKDLTRTMLFTNRIMTFMMPALMLIMNATSILTVWVSANKIDQGKLEVGAMTAFITYTMMIIMSFLMITILSIMLPRAIVAAKRIDDVIKTEVSIANKDNCIEEKAQNGVITFNHVTFHYPDAEGNVLEDIDFEAKPGCTTAIIGSTGCGKSTLIKLIPRFYDVTEGSVTLDGIDIKDISLKTLREQIGYVPQKGVLFSGTIKSNIGYGAGDISEDVLKESARIAQATEFIDEKNNQYDSSISQGGTNVSGGQKQRLSIARAIARDPKIYIFDDSFSALDLKTDVALRKALGPKFTKATVFIVAQRVSTILNADQILVLDDGKIVGKGTHRELIDTCETYRMIAESQLSEAELAASIQEKEA